MPGPLEELTAFPMPLAEFKGHGRMGRCKEETGKGIGGERQRRKG